MSGEIQDDYLNKSLFQKEKHNLNEKNELHSLDDITEGNIYLYTFYFYGIKKY